MADYQDPVEDVVPAADDVDMGDAAVAEEGAEEAAAENGETAADAEEAGEVEIAEVEVAEAEIPKRTTFAEYLSSPVVTLEVGGAGSENQESARLTAHQALLVKSPYFATLCEGLDEDRTIELPDENLDAVGCFLEFLYTGDYFPRKLPGHTHALETDPSLPAIDENGDQLLKHARVYTLAQKLGLEYLQALASSKIHCVPSTAQGEIAYARYVYACTKPDDTVVRHPVAKFWAMRSHTLRAEAEKEFQALCLEHPQFAYDVLTRVLDEKLKRERDDKMYPAVPEKGIRPPATGSVRKRARNSSNVQ